MKPPPFDLIANLLRIAAGSNFHLSPFHHLYRRKGTTLESVPPSVKAKIKELHKLESLSPVKISDLIEELMNEKIRNSYFHSDYCLTDTEYRWTEGGPSQRVSLSSLSETVDKASAFYSAFFQKWNVTRNKLVSAKRVHKLPGYETLELTSDTKGNLNGFIVHFSNGNKATFRRDETGLIAHNLIFEKNGDVNFMVGMTSELKPAWHWNGQIVTDFTKLP